MSLRKLVKNERKRPVLAKGILSHDWTAVSPFQRESTAVLGFNMQLEQEAYLSQHPEIGALLASYISKINYKKTKLRTEVFEDTAKFFNKSCEILSMAVQDVLGKDCLQQPEETYTKKGQIKFHYKNEDLEEHLANVRLKYYPRKHPDESSSDKETDNTLSSSFLSFRTSDTTIPTPEPVPTPPPTFEQLVYQMVSNTVDKAIFSLYDSYAINYDTAYVELCKAVETAMEIPVIEIREEIADLLGRAYEAFQDNIIEKERIHAAKEWEKRMRKKLKRTLRRANNFRGYVTPTSSQSKSTMSTHESYKKPPPPPCKCHPQWTFNRYAKVVYFLFV